ncbi:hypothetical protein ACROYT_G038470 [Oculina patagonica]
MKSTRQFITDKLFLDVFLVYPGIAAKEKQIVTDRNGRKSSKLLVEFIAKTVKDKIPLRNQVRENRNSRGAVNVCDDEGSTRVAEFPQSCRHRKR